jgi:hypothetical protein
VGARLWPLQEYILLANVPGATSAVLDQDVSKCVVEAHQQALNQRSAAAETPGGSRRTEPDRRAPS